MASLSQYLDYTVPELEAELAEYRAAIKARKLAGFTVALQSGSNQLQKAKEDLKELERTEIVILRALFTLDPTNWPNDPQSGCSTVANFTNTF